MATMGNEVNINGTDGNSFSAWQAAPAGRPRGAIIVIQEIFGVNRHIRSLCDRYAEDGYLALAPALYDRVALHVSLGYGPEGVARGREIRMQIDDATALRDIASTIEYIRSDPTGISLSIATIGFCMGGTLSWLAATRLAHVSAAISYYGTGIATYVHEVPKVPVLLHFGEQDAHIPRSAVDEIALLHPDVELHRYNAGHGFNCDDRPAFEPESAALAMERTRRFLADKLESR
jgi:carboxymethylenebutenolidase